MQVYYPPNGLQTTFSSVPDTNDIPKSTTTKTSSKSSKTKTKTTTTKPATTTTTTDSTSPDIISQAKDFFQDNSTSIFIGVGLGVLLFITMK